MFDDEEKQRSNGKKTVLKGWKEMKEVSYYKHTHTHNFTMASVGRLITEKQCFLKGILRGIS